MAEVLENYASVSCYIEFTGNNAPIEGSINLGLYDKNTKQLVLEATAVVDKETGEWYYKTTSRVNIAVINLKDTYGPTNIYNNIEWKLLDSFTNYNIKNVTYTSETIEGTFTEWANKSTMTLECVNCIVNTVNIKDIFYNNQKIEQIYLNNQKVYGLEPIKLTFSMEYGGEDNQTSSFSGVSKDDMIINTNTGTSHGITYSYYPNQTLVMNSSDLVRYTISKNGTVIISGTNEDNMVMLNRNICETYDIKSGDTIDIKLSTNQISFGTITSQFGGPSYTCDEGMTWEDFVNSSYNTNNYVIEAASTYDPTLVIKTASNGTYCFSLSDKTTYVKPTDLIIEDYLYYTVYISNTMNFTISGTTYTAYKNSTWEEWVASDYNTLGAYVYDFGDGDIRIIWEDDLETHYIYDELDSAGYPVYVAPTDTIISGHAYERFSELN